MEANKKLAQEAWCSNFSIQGFTLALRTCWAQRSCGQFFGFGTVGVGGGLDLGASA